MKDHAQEHTIEKMAEVFNVSRSGYYKWLNKSISSRKLFNNMLVGLIKEIQENSRFSMGAIKITRKLNEMDFNVNHKRVSRLMKINSLNFKAKKKFKVCTVSGKNDTYSPNILNREFTVSKSNAVWVSDITYLRCKEGWLYLCVILDLFSRKVVGYSVSESMSTELVLSSFWNAVAIAKPKKGLLFHSDRGTQYCSKAFRNVLNSQGMIQSMSRKGNCWDNACAETFFRSLKVEWFYDAGNLNRKEVKSLIFEYIEVFYNKFRPHYSLGLKTPEEFEKECA